MKAHRAVDLAVLFQQRHLIDATGEHAGKDYRTVRGEIEAYGQGLADKREIVALTKVDALDAATRKSQALKLKRACGTMPLMLSSASREGVEAVLRALMAVGLSILLTLMLFALGNDLLFCR